MIIGLFECLTAARPELSVRMQRSSEVDTCRATALDANDLRRSKPCGLFPALLVLEILAGRLRRLDEGVMLD